LERAVFSGTAVAAVDDDVDAESAFPPQTAAFADPSDASPTEAQGLCSLGNAVFEVLALQVGGNLEPVA
jgi:hypothetical protein